MTTMKVLLTVFLLSTLIGIGCARTCGSVGGYCSNGRCGRGYYVVRGVSGCWNRQTCCAKSYNSNGRDWDDRYERPDRDDIYERNDWN
ncbi:Hypothetical predicted protein [Mytilus galloprovincialis]|uniref:Uncharacterized protein n=1 Tax=Mytilus galloprovincialis TaxID=29158 RepID=A0A8B6DQP3_MYTGA|nr:Hypothetical predicted protein [Mytilus galloprovincialis]